MNPPRLNVVPHIVSAHSQGLNAQTAMDTIHREFLWEGEDLHPQAISKLAPLLKMAKPGFRTSVNLEGQVFLVALFEGEVRFYSPRLNQELFTLQELESLGWKEMVESESFKVFKDHVLKAASLSSMDTPSILERITQTQGLPDLLHERTTDQELELRKKLVQAMGGYRPSLFEKLSDHGLGLTAEYALIRVHLLKFLAILPSLDHDSGGTIVKSTLLESLRRLVEDSDRCRSLNKRGQERPLPKGLERVFRMALSVAKLIPAWLLATLIRSGVRTMARRFIAGESIGKATKSLRSLFATGRDVSIDQLGELVVSRAEADQYGERVLEIIRGFHQHVPPGTRNGAGILRAQVSIKVTGLCHDFKPEALDYTYDQVAPRLLNILRAAQEHQVFVNVDAEHYHYRDAVLWIFARALEQDDLRTFGDTGIVLQAYLRDASQHLDQILGLAKGRGIPMPVRLVKGAYWDAETVEAEAHSFDAPQFLNKEETDLHFRQLVHRFLSPEASAHLQLCLASHNFSDHAYAEALRKHLAPSSPPIEHQCLHMTYEALSVAMASLGWTVRNYVPVGSLLVGMAYLVRRIMENSSQVGILTQMRSHKVQSNPPQPGELHLNKKAEGRLSWDLNESSLTSGFFNVAPMRLYLREDLDCLASALRTSNPFIQGLALVVRSTPPCVLPIPIFRWAPLPLPRSMRSPSLFNDP